MQPPRLPRPGSVLGIGLVLLALASALAFAGHETTVASFTGCLTINSGTLVSLAPGNAPLAPCRENQMQVHLSGGDITAVTAGTGLQGGATNGPAPLSVHPSYRLPQECATGGVPKWTGSAWACDTDTDPVAFGGFAEVGGPPTCAGSFWTEGLILGPQMTVSAGSRLRSPGPLIRRCSCKTPRAARR